MSPLLSLFWVLVGIAILVVLNLKFKLHNIFSLLIAGIFVAIMEQIPIDKVVGVVQEGLGSIMGHLALIIIFGAIIGKFMTESGSSQQIADTVIRRCGTRFLSVGLMFIGVIFGIAMFGETVTKTPRGIFVGRSDEPLLDGIVRLARLFNTPEDIPILVAQTMREILYRVLAGQDGRQVAQLALNGSILNRIARVITTLKTHFDQPLSIAALAQMAGMSVSTFHAHFKSVTVMSPLQYQKSLRLIEARALMLSRQMDVSGAAWKVGYESPSQFSREYARMFGNPPARDIGLLSQHAMAT